MLQSSCAMCIYVCVPYVYPLCTFVYPRVPLCTLVYPLCTFVYPCVPLCTLCVPLCTLVQYPCVQYLRHNNKNFTCVIFMTRNEERWVGVEVGHWNILTLIIGLG